MPTSPTLNSLAGGDILKRVLEMGFQPTSQPSVCPHMYQELAMLSTVCRQWFDLLKGRAFSTLIIRSARLKPAPANNITRIVATTAKLPIMWYSNIDAIVAANMAASTKTVRIFGRVGEATFVSCLTSLFEGLGLRRVAWPNLESLRIETRVDFDRDQPLDTLVQQTLAYFAQNLPYLKEIYVPTCVISPSVSPLIEGLIVRCLPNLSCLHIARPFPKVDITMFSHNITKVKLHGPHVTNIVPLPVMFTDQLRNLELTEIDPSFPWSFLTQAGSSIVNLPNVERLVLDFDRYGRQILSVKRFPVRIECARVKTLVIKCALRFYEDFYSAICVEARNRVEIWESLRKLQYIDMNIIKRATRLCVTPYYVGGESNGNMSEFTQKMFETRLMARCLKTSIQYFPHHYPVTWPNLRHIELTVDVLEWPAIEQFVKSHPRLWYLSITCIARYNHYGQGVIAGDILDLPPEHMELISTNLQVLHVSDFSDWSVQYIAWVKKIMLSAPLLIELLLPRKYTAHFEEFAKANNRDIAFSVQ